MNGWNDGKIIVVFLNNRCFQLFKSLKVSSKKQQDYFKNINPWTLKQTLKFTLHNPTVFSRGVGQSVLTTVLLPPSQTPLNFVHI